MQKQRLTPNVRASAPMVVEHSLNQRSWYEAANQNRPKPETLATSRHTPVVSFASLFYSLDLYIIHSYGSSLAAALPSWSPTMPPLRLAALVIGSMHVGLERAKAVHHPF